MLAAKRFCAIPSPCSPKNRVDSVADEANGVENGRGSIDALGEPAEEDNAHDDADNRSGELRWRRERKWRGMGQEIMGNKRGGGGYDSETLTAVELNDRL